MSRSSATHIAYDLRPVKQTERRIILDILRLSREAGIQASSCSYIGMGGVKFYDFKMLHRYLGIRTMISLEQDKGLLPRCEFNKPLGFIDIRPKLSTDFIDEHKFTGPAIVWLDYDWGLSKTVTSDAITLATKLQLGSFVFITVRGELATQVATLSAPERIEHFREELGQLALDCTSADVEIDGHPRYVERVMNAALTRAFASRADGVFRPLLRIIYRDTTWMTTVGGCFFAERDGDALFARLKVELPFLYAKADEPYVLDDLIFTPKERVLLDLSVTSNPITEEHRNLLKKLKFSKKRVDAYRSIVRYMPRYVETFI